MRPQDPAQRLRDGLGGILKGMPPYFISGDKMAKRVVCLLDGFNIYHAIDKNHPARCKWCNYRKLVENNYLLPGEELTRIIYFSAYAKWNHDKVNRHHAFIKALRNYDVETVMGKFKQKTLICQAECGKSYSTYEEKQSDVNIGVAMTRMAYEDEYDKLILVSGDSDFVSTIRFLKDRFLEKTVEVVIPGGHKCSKELKDTAHFHRVLERGHPLSSLLPIRLELTNGEVVNCPEKYRRI